MRGALRMAGLLALVTGLLLSGTGVILATAGATSQQTDCSYPVRVTDGTGTVVTIEDEPDEVVTLSPSAAQTMWEIGAKDKVVGVSKHASYLDGAETRANISGAGYTTVVVEKVIDEDPDLVLAPNIIDEQTVEKLRKSGYTVYWFGPSTSMEDVKDKTLLIGQLVGECEGAHERVDEMETTISLIREAVADEERPTVLYHLGGKYTAGSGTFIDSLIETAGGTNVAASQGIEGYQIISDEVVVNQTPDFIVHPSNPRGADLPAVYNTTPAVQEGNVVEVEDNYMNQPAPRTVRALETMVQAFHPEAYEEALESQTTTTTTTSTTEETTAETTGTTETADTTTEEATTTETETTTTEAPGVGVLGVGVALLLVTFLGRYR